MLAERTSALRAAYSHFLTWYLHIEEILFRSLFDFQLRNYKIRALLILASVKENEALAPHILQIKTQNNPEKIFFDNILNLNVS